jgi:hypothetical protein
MKFSPFAGTNRIRFSGCDLSPSGHPGAVIVPARLAQQPLPPRPALARRLAIGLGQAAAHIVVCLLGVGGVAVGIEDAFELWVIGDVAEAVEDGEVLPDVSDRGAGRRRTTSSW